LPVWAVTKLSDFGRVVFPGISFLDKKLALGLFVFPLQSMANTNGKENIAPVWTRTMGNVTVAIYRNEISGRKAPLYKVTRKRWYVSAGEIKTVTSLFRDDIPCARLLEEEAWQEIYRMQKADREALKASGGSAKETKATASDEVLDEDVVAAMAE